MDVGKILRDLRQKRDELEQAIESLERLARTRGDRRGRPPAWLGEIKKRRGRPPGSKNKPRAEVGATHGASVVAAPRETVHTAAAA